MSNLTQKGKVYSCWFIKWLMQQNFRKQESELLKVIQGSEAYEIYCQTFKQKLKNFLLMIVET